MDKELKRLIAKADKASSKCCFGCYPMAPSVGLSEREIALHQKAMDACAEAAEALTKAGLNDEASVYNKAKENHSWVVRRRGAF